MNKNYFIFSIIFIIINLCSPVRSREKIVLSGKIYNSVTKKKIDFATVAVLEVRLKARTDRDGFYSIEVPEAGTYTIYVTSAGLKARKARIHITESITKDFILSPVEVKGSALTIRGEREIQKVSRRTMTVQEIKDVPASFGDSINALTSLPGVIRTSGGFFGPLVIRGMYPDKNRYFLDGMPIYNPMHFGGFHSVIANDLMSEIDLYSSSFPSRFGGALAAVIDINTIDTVKEFGGNTDIGMISATALIKTPITREVLKEGKLTKQNAGYFIVSGRVGYLSLLIPLFYRIIVGEKLESVPQYWDYQVKGKYYLSNNHSITILALGSKDYFRFLRDDDVSDLEEGEDPLLTDIDFDYDQVFHNQGLYYTYQLDRFKNVVMFYSAFNNHYAYINVGNLDAASWVKDLYVDSRPNIYGLRDMLNFEWWKKRGELRTAFEITFYDFRASGKEFILTKRAFIDLADEDAVFVTDFDDKFINFTIGGYLDNRFTIWGFTFVPGVRFDYLYRTGHITFAPRGMLSYDFPTDTTLSVAGGMYSSFFQTNPFIFAFAPNYARTGGSLGPEKAYHGAAGIEQVLGLFTVGVEAFYNFYYDLAMQYYSDEDGGELRNCGRLKAYGAELMIRKDTKEGSNDFYGWLSYTFTQSREKSGLPPDYDSTGDRWFISDQEQEHALKFVLGYRYNKQTISSRFQLYTSFPYTPIIGDDDDPLSIGRYAPVYDYENRNSKHFPVDFRLDIRYSYKTNYEWGYVSWYIEIINVLGAVYKPKDFWNWKYNKPYEKGINPVLRSSPGLSIIPNFGVEVKF